MNTNRFEIKRLRFCLLLFLITLLFESPVWAQVNKIPIVAKDAKLQMVSNQFTFTEGPAADKAGNVFFTDQPNNRIWEYHTSGKITLYMDHTGRANGTFFAKNGNLITCSDRHNQLWSISPNKKVKILVSGFKGKRLNGPNDLWIAPNGGIYFTDPYYQRLYWKRTKPDIKQQRVYYLTPNRKKVFIVADDLQKPNGIIGTPNGKKLYIADIGAGKTYSYSINPDGHLSHKKLFVDMGSDGMTIDNRGDIFLCGNGVTIFNKHGKKLGHIPIHQKWTANITFGGPHRKTLFITASKAIYTLKMKVKGVR